MSIIYDNSNAADMLKEKYKQTYKKPPTQAVNQVISLLDDIILSEWEKCMSLLDLEAQKFASQGFGFIVPKEHIQKCFLTNPLD